MNITVTVTDAARNFADCVNRAHYQRVTFVLVKNGKPVARIVPDSGRVCTGRELADALASAELPAEEARAWDQDIQAGMKRLKGPSDKWR